jgi:hypothetical protein
VAVQVQLNDGTALIVELTLDQMREAYETALRNGTILEVTNGNGKTRAVNPNLILSFEEADSPATSQASPAA